MPRCAALAPADERELLSEVSSAYTCAYQPKMCFPWIFRNIYLNRAVSAKVAGSERNRQSFHG